MATWTGFTCDAVGFYRCENECLLSENEAKECGMGGVETSSVAEESSPGEPLVLNRARQRLYKRE